MSSIVDCVENGVEPCGRDPAVVCDVDNNGAVDYCDVDYTVNLFMGMPVPQACEEPCGACCRAAPEEPACIMATEGGCPGYGGVYAGDGTSCEGDDDGDGIANACDPRFNAFPPLPEPAVRDVGFGSRVRYLSFVAGYPGRNQAIRVTISYLPAPFQYANGCQFWVGEPQLESEAAGSHTAPPDFFWTATLQLDPFYTDWSVYDSVHVHSDSIVPSGLYWFQVIDDTCSPLNEDEYSDVLEIRTSRWGDVMSRCGVTPRLSPDGQANLDDVAGLVEKFKNSSIAPSKSQADIAPSLPDRHIDFLDISAAVDAFRGKQFPYSGPSPVLCPNIAVCGNGVPEPGEQCDDGNANNTDACAGICRNARCGDGFVWAGIEQCDDGNTIAGDGCDGNCQAEAEWCGDGIVNGGEDCDDGGESADCDVDCTLPECGDGTLNRSAGEECDDGNVVGGDGCNATCQIEGVATVSLVPVRATVPHMLSGGNEIVIPSGGGVVELEIYLSGWGPALLEIMQVTIDSSGYTSGTAGSLTPHTITCANGAGCVSGFSTEFGEDMGVCTFAGTPCAQDVDCPPYPDQCQGSACDFPTGVGGYCEPGYILWGRDDCVDFQIMPTDLSASDYRYAGTTGIAQAELPDPGVPVYVGTLLLEVSPDAAGTFTVGFVEDDTYMCYAAEGSIPVKYLEPARITVYPCTVPGTPAPPPPSSPYYLPNAGNGVRIRYLAFAGGTPGAQEAVRVTAADLPPNCEDRVGEAWWVTQPRQYCEMSGKGPEVPPQDCPSLPPGEVLPKTFWAATLECTDTPYATDWSVYDTVHVFGQQIVPSKENRPGGPGTHDWAIYDVQFVGQGHGSVGFCFSEPLEVKMSVWGDVVATTPYGARPDGKVDFMDIQCVIDRFKNSPGAPSKSRTDLAGETPSRVIDYVDIPGFVDAFKGRLYPYGCPGACP